MRLIAAVIGLAAAASAGSAAAGAFGIEMGTPISKLQVVNHETGTDFYTIKVPLPNSEFEAYTVRATAAHGVCRIAGIGKDHDGDRSGVAVRMAYGTLKATLSAKYGKTKNYDFLHAGSIWDDVGDWAMSLNKKERSYVDFWGREEGSTLPADVESIMLEARATDSSTTYVTLSYEFSNMDACTAGAKAADSKGL